MAKGKLREKSGKEDAKPLNRKNLSKLIGIFNFVLPYKKEFAVGLVLLILSSFLLLTFPFLAGKLIDAASGRNEWIIVNINHIALMLGGILLLQGIISYLRVYLFSVVSEKSMADIRYRLYSNMIGLPIAFFDDRRSGELISRITSDVSMLQSAISVTLAEFVRQAATLVIGTTIIFFTASRLTWFMLAVLPLVIIIGVLFSRYIRSLSRRTQDEMATANVVAEETIQAIRVVKAFTSELFETIRYRKAMDKVVKVALHAAKFRGFFISFVIFILFGTVVAVIWYGARLVQTGAMSVGDLMSFVLYSTFIGGSIAGLGDIVAQIQRAIGASDRVLEIINKKGEARIDTPPEKLAINGKINFENVSFAYPSRKNALVLKNVDFEILPGQKVALVGASGAGKSTVIQLLMRFYNIQHGDIKVDGKSIACFNLPDYRRHIGIVPQEVILFGGSIRENIAYGKFNASDAEIREAAVKANAMEFIERLPDGFETLVGDRGTKLSGGQKQRIAIARAILKNPEILILDEATSSLDAHSEKLVQDALDLLMKNRTTIIIAHRLATIRKADRIYVFAEGRIIESGTHEELLLQEGNYSNLIRMQMEVR